MERSPYEMLLIERASALLGVDSFALMENAGREIAKALAEGSFSEAFREKALEEDHGLSSKKIVFTCGTGNNAGDGFTALMHLLEKGCNAKAVLAAGEPKAKEAKKAYERLVEKSPEAVNAALNDLNDADIIIDTIFGTGFRGAPAGEYAKAINAINTAKGTKVSIDVPSGFDCMAGTGKLFVRADQIYFLHASKKVPSDSKAKTRILDIGIPSEAENIVFPRDAEKCLKERSATSHKGENGVVAIIAGSNSLSGAAMMSANSAKTVFRSAADIVYALCPSKVSWLINLKIPEVISRKLEGDFLGRKHEKEIRETVEKCDAILIGPGIGKEKETFELVKSIVQGTGKKIVLDADAIRAVKGMKFQGNVLLTPHAGEFEECFGEKLPKGFKERARIVESTAKKQDCTILLKGALDIISNGKKTVFNATGNSAMTTAGTGDVLAGICTALAAKNNLFDAACSAAFINGYAGDKVFKEKNYGLIATDIIDEIPRAIKEIMGI